MASRLLLESGSPDGYLLEDSSGILLLEATAYSLVVDPGSFALTGTAAALKRGLKLAADIGAFSHTGTAASLEISYKVSGAAGSFSLTGVSAGLLVSRKVLASAGSINISGTAAGLLFGHKVVSSTGDFIITGSSVTLSKGFTLSTAAGSFSIVGSAVTFALNRRLAVDTGAITLSGSAVSFILTIPPPIVATISLAARLDNANIVLQSSLVNETIIRVGKLNITVTGLNSLLSNYSFDASIVLNLSATGSLANLTLLGGLMAVDNQNIRLYAGDSKVLSVTVADATDIAGSTITFTVKRDNTVIFTQTGTITGLKTFTVSLIPSNTSGLVGAYKHGTKLVDGSGNVNTIMLGELFVDPAVS